ncbi:MAG: o-succinylbenzoate synthase [Candidatus Bipolaricaulota bacterium]|nr:MAG: o-succinylbenzoate synthase [Candidatus Bipolaricaulota bacterium]
MHIERAELRLLRLPLVHPFETSFGRETENRVVVVRLFADGLEGFGESAAGVGPWYSYETAETCWSIQRDLLVPLLLAHGIDAPSDIPQLFASVRGHPIAKTGIEEAVWDLCARREEHSLSAALGGTRERIESGVSLGIQESADRLLDRIESFVEEGYRRVKLKIKPGWDHEVVERVRSRFPDLPLMVDANAAYSLDDLPLLRALDRFDLMMIEQPLHYADLLDHAKLQAAIETPLCLDESIASARHAAWAIELGSCRIVNIKPGRVGGLCEARAVHDLCQEHGLPVWCGGLLESGIGRAHNVAVASLPNFSLPGDLSGSARYYAEDLVDPPFALAGDGTMEVPVGAGIGVEVVERRLAEATIRHEVFTA